MIIKHQFRAMGTRMVAAQDESSVQPASLLNKVPNWFEEWEQTLSRFRDDSELSHLNQHNGAPVPVSDVLWDVLETAEWVYHFSGGLVTPTVLPALEYAGYDISFDDLLPAANLYISTSACDPFTSLIKRFADRSVQLPAGMKLDFGGVAKGWAAHKASQMLAPFGPALVDAGGDIAISGFLSNNQPWLIGVEDPLGEDRYLEILRLGACGVATSGRDHRRWRQGEIWQHHIIDPRSGYPADTDILSVTVVAPTVIVAEAAAKTVLIMGSQDGLYWLERHPELAGIIVLDNGDRIYSQRMHNYLKNHDDTKDKREKSNY